MQNWFDVNKEGLAKLLEKKGKKFAIAELISNAWDQNVTEVTINLSRIEGARNLYHLQVVDDDPNGFDNLAHAYTLFAESAKKGEATKRGRFNIGEKLVLAVCDEAIIQSTKGGVKFDKDGRHSLRTKRAAGSIFEGKLRMTRDEFEEANAFVRTLIPPAHVRTLFNETRLQNRTSKVDFETSLATEIADAEGFMRKTVRKTTVRVYEPLPDEIPSLYEMGIPVVETGDKWHIDIQQKVPLNMDRDNVPPAFLRTVRTEVLNRLYQSVQKEEVNETWVRDAAASDDAAPEAVNHVLTQMFGEKRVIFDASDHEANKLAASQGYTVISGNSLPRGMWAHVREHELALPAGRVTPSPRVQIEMALGHTAEENFVPETKWTEGQRNIVNYSKAVAQLVKIGTINVKLINDIGQNFRACYGDQQLIYNLGRLGYAWFEQGLTVDVNALLIHELAHHYSSDHLSSDYYRALTTLAGKLINHAFTTPEFFAAFNRRLSPA